MIYVIDDFYDNVNEVVNFANKLTFKEDVCGEHFLRTYGIACKNVGKRIEEVLGIEMDWYEFSQGVRGEGMEWNVWEGPPDKEDYTNMNGSFYKPRKDFVADHLHHDWYDWGGIVYLNNDLPPTYGTQFWRIPSTGEYTADTSNGYDERCSRENQTNGFFEKTDYISNRFNRLVLFKGLMFHSAVVPDHIMGLNRLCQFWQIKEKS